MKIRRCTACDYIAGTTPHPKYCEKAHGDPDGKNQHAYADVEMTPEQLAEAVSHVVRFVTDPTDMCRTLFIGESNGTHFTFACSREEGHRPPCGVDGDPPVVADEPLSRAQWGRTRTTRARLSVSDGVSSLPVPLEPAQISPHVAVAEFAENLNGADSLAFLLELAEQGDPVTNFIEGLKDEVLKGECRKTVRMRKELRSPRSADERTRVRSDRSVRASHSSVGASAR